MGVKNLWDILESCKKTLPLHHLQNKRVCIDLSCWMVQLQSVNRTHCAMKEKLYLRGLFHRVRALISLNCSVIFVTDGAIPAIKISTYRRRLNALNEVTQDDVDRHKVASLKRNMGSEFSCMVKEAKLLGMALGIPCLDGIEEAEAQCALLNAESLCDGCFTSDSDIFLFGARTVYRDICLDKGGYIVCYEMSDIEKKLGLGRHSLVALSLLLGSDYSHGVRGFGPESACQVIRSISEDVVLQRVASDGISFLKSLKTSKKRGQIPERRGKENHTDYQVKATDQPPLEKDNDVLPVIEAYMKPKCHPVDSDAVYRVLMMHSFQRAKLQEICSQFFDWPPEKTDEYILPKIAERELRKFANLRLSSSHLGAVLPLYMMPVRCPISEIVKHRKVQGRECFEVSWEEFDGLKTSIVPADLVKSACPEKITEFEERKAQKKKPNGRKARTKKTDDTTSVVNVNAKLQSLLLDIESEDNTTVNPSSKHNSFIPHKPEDGAPRGGQLAGSGLGPLTNGLCDKLPTHQPSSINSIDLTTESLVLDIESEYNATVNLTSKHNSCIPQKPEDKAPRGGQSAGSGLGPLTNGSCDKNPTHQPSSMNSIDLTTETLVLDIESEYNARHKVTSNSCSSSSRISIEVDVTISDTFLDEEYERRNVDSEPCVDPHKSDFPTSMETDVIDLLSPSPVNSTRYLSKCQGNVEEVSVIDLSDSDMEISPEHARKARELRLFLSSIREEIS